MISIEIAVTWFFTRDSDPEVLHFANRHDESSIEINESIKRMQSELCAAQVYNRKHLTHYCVIIM